LHPSPSDSILPGRFGSFEFRIQPLGESPAHRLDRVGLQGADVQSHQRGQRGTRRPQHGIEIVECLIGLRIERILANHGTLAIHRQQLPSMHQGAPLDCHRRR